MNTIIDFIVISSNLTLALTKDTHLIAWLSHPHHHNSHTNTTITKNNGQLQTDFPYLPSEFEYRLSTNSTGIALTQLRNHIYIVLNNQVKIVNVDDLQAFIKKYKSSKLHHKFDTICKIIKQQNDIQTIAMLSVNHQQSFMFDQSKQNQQDNTHHGHSCVIFSNKAGKLVQIKNSNNPSLHQICDISSFKISNNSSFHEHPSHHGVHSTSQFITSVLPYRENTLLLAGTNYGRILIISIIANKVIEDITARNQLKFTNNNTYGGRINKLILSTGGHRFYSLHDNCIIQWSMELQKCLGYYQYYYPYCALYTQKFSVDRPKLLITGSNRYISTIDVQKPTDIFQFQSNLESIHVIKQINDKIYVAGKNGIIQIIQLGITQAILYQKQQISYH